MNAGDGSWWWKGREEGEEGREEGGKGVNAGDVGREEEMERERGSEGEEV